MKSTTVLTAAAVLVCLSALPSATEGSNGLRVGLKVGNPWSWISYDDPRGQQTTGTDTRIWSGGIVLEWPHGDSSTLTFVSGVTYVVKSGEADGVDGGTAVDEQGSALGALALDWTGYYFAVPLMVKRSLVIGQLRPYVAGGAEIAIPVKGEQSIEISPTEGVYLRTGGPKDVTDDMRVLEFSLAAAAGLEFPIGSSAGFVEVEYVHGLNDVWRAHPEEVRYRMIMVSGGVMF